MTVKAEGMDKAKRFLLKFPKDKENEARNLINFFGFKIQGIAEGKAPVGADGRLKNDVNFKIEQTGSVLEGHLGFSVEYAKFVHGVNVGGKWIGPKRHFVPFSVAPDLLRWARLKGVGEDWKTNWGKKWAEKSGKDISKIKGLWVGGVDKANPFLYEAAMAQRNAIHKGFRNLAEVK